MAGPETGCRRCYLPGSFPRLDLDAQGVCRFCRALSTEDAVKLRAELHARDRLAELKVLAEQMKAERARCGGKYDCIIGASGGLDSTYIVYVAKRLLSLDPLVIKYDNGFAHEVANANLRRACDKLGVECRILGPYPVERKYLVNAVKSLRHLGLYFSACFSCHYTILSLVYQIASDERIRYKLSATNEIEHSIALSSHRFMLGGLVKRFLKALPFRALAVVYYQLLAQYYLFRLKLHMDGLSLRLLRNQFRLHPRPPTWLHNIDLDEYVAWDAPKMEQILRQELGWQTPHDLKVPYMRFDCHFSALIDKSFQEATGIPVHAVLANYFVQTGLVTREEMRADMAYLTDMDRIREQMGIVARELGVDPKSL